MWLVLNSQVKAFAKQVCFFPMHCLNLSANKKMENGETESLSSEDDSVVVSLLEQKKKKILGPSDPEEQD